jgi:hypothetical protein
LRWNGLLCVLGMANGTYPFCMAISFCMAFICFCCILRRFLSHLTRHYLVHYEGVFTSPKFNKISCYLSLRSSSFYKMLGSSFKQRSTSWLYEEGQHIPARQRTFLIASNWSRGMKIMYLGVWMLSCFDFPPFETSISGN